MFGAYYAKLLRDKTAASQQREVAQASDIEKTYRALCVVTGNRELPPVGVVIRHYLEVSKRAPKTFHDDDEEGEHQECLLRIKRISNVVDDLTAHQREVLDLPSEASGVFEVEIELLTGRTHQIRGQFMKLGFPIAGDRLYGGGSRVWEAGDEEELR